MLKTRNNIEKSQFSKYINKISKFKHFKSDNTFLLCVTCEKPVPTT